MMLPTVCFFLGMAMMACTIVGYACIKIQVKDWVIRINDGIL